MVVLVCFFRDFWQRAEVERQERKESMTTRAFSSLKFKGLANPSPLMNINKHPTFATNKTCFPVPTTWRDRVAVWLHSWTLTEPPALLRTAAKHYGFSSTPPSLIPVLLLKEKKLMHINKREKKELFFQQQQDFSTGSCMKAILIPHKSVWILPPLWGREHLCEWYNKPTYLKIVACWDLSASTHRRLEHLRLH